MPASPDPNVPPGSTAGGPRGRGRNGCRSLGRDVALDAGGRREPGLFLLGPPDEVGAWAIDGDRLRRLPWSLPPQATRFALAPDGRTLAVAVGGDRAGGVALLDPSDGRVLHRLKAPGEAAGPIFSLAFSPDGRELAVGGREQIRLWSLAGPSPAPIVRLGGSQGPINVLAYDPSGRHLASGSFDGTVKVWDLDHVRGKLAELGLD